MKAHKSESSNRPAFSPLGQCNHAIPNQITAHDKMPPSLATSIGGVALECCIYNASGPKSGHVSDLVNVAASRSGAVLSKSATLEKQCNMPPA